MRLRNQSGRRGRGIEEKHFENLLLRFLAAMEYAQREEDGTWGQNVQYFFKIYEFKSFVLKQAGLLASQGIYSDFFNFISSDGEFERLIFRFSNMGVLCGDVINGLSVFALTPRGFIIGREQVIAQKLIYSNN